MLVRNGRNINQNPAKFSGSVWGDSGNRFKAALRNRDGAFDPVFSAYPSGTLAPGGFALPLKDGAISSYTLSTSSISAFADLIAGRNMELSATLQITVTNAQLDQIVSAVVNGTLSLAVASAVLAGAANANAFGTITLTVNSALCGAIVNAIANASGVITPSVTITAQGFMQAVAGGATPLSPEGLARAVWSSTAIANNDAGTMGEKLNDAGSAGNPWAAEVASNTTPGTFGAFVQKTLNVAKFLGLK